MQRVALGSTSTIQYYLLAELAVPSEQNEPAKGQQLGAYRDLKTYAAVKKMFEGLLEMCNASRKPVQLVFFDDALDQLLRMHRTLCLPQARCFVSSRNCLHHTWERLRTITGPKDAFHTLSSYLRHCLMLT